MRREALGAQRAPFDRARRLEERSIVLGSGDSFDADADAACFTSTSSRTCVGGRPNARWNARRNASLDA
jgi:hypothetical protein